MRILLYHGKTGPSCWLADTRDQLNAAMQAMFREIDTLGCYSSYPREFYQAFTAARNGDARQTRAILNMRNGRKWESWELLYADDPRSPCIEEPTDA